MYIRDIVLSTNDEFTVILDDAGVPLYYENLFIIQCLHNVRIGISSTRHFYNALKVLAVWQKYEQVDILKLLSSGDGLSDAQIGTLCTCLGTKVKFLKKRAVVTATIPSSTKNRKRVITIPSIHLTEITTQIIRIGYARRYIVWLSKRLQENSSTIQEAMEASFRTYTPKSGIDDDYSIDDGVDPLTVEKVLYAISPFNSDNFFSGNLSPVKAKPVRLRNFLIVFIFFKTGMRLGELLCLRIEDLNFKKNTIKIKRRHDDGEDPRTKKPKVKTRNRTLKLAKDIMAAIKTYLGFRIKTYYGPTYPFVFVTHIKGVRQTGFPLSIDSVEKVFDKIRKNVAAADINDFHPHALRHTWNYLYSKHCDENRDTISVTDEFEQRCYEMGWDPTGETAQKYNKRHIVEKALEAEVELGVEFADIYSGGE